MTSVPTQIPATEHLPSALAYSSPLLGGTGCCAEITCAPLTNHRVSWVPLSLLSVSKWHHYEGSFVAVLLFSQGLQVQHDLTSLI